MTEHTPGPWFVGPTPRYLAGLQQADGKARRIDPLTIRSPHHTEEIATVWNYLLPTEANARLIAAAPDLLAALERIVIAEFGRLDSPAIDGAGYWVAARDAIAKAKGEANA